MIWYIALCLDCEPLLTMPFTDAAERDEWAAAHREPGPGGERGHRVLCGTEVRSVGVV